MPAAEEVQRIAVRLIEPNPYQPRRTFDEDQIAELAASIRQYGVIQPIILRAVGVRFQLVAGERRLRAVKQLGLTDIPAIVRKYTDEQALEAALIENLQREDITVVETAHAYQRLTNEFHYSQAEIAQRTGRSRQAVSNTLRLLQLPEGVLNLLHRGEVSEGHARALLSLPSAEMQGELADYVVRNGATVRETEEKVRAVLAGEEPAAPSEPKPAAPAPDPNLRAMEERLRHLLGTKVRLNYRAGKGRITVEFYSDEELQRILDLLASSLPAAAGA